MKNSNLIIILKKELKELFRDKKSLAMIIIIPLMIPLIVIGMSALFEAQMNKDVSKYNRIGFSYELSEEESNLALNMNIEVINGTEEELEQKYNNKEIDLYVTKDNTTYILNYDESENSSYASKLVESFYNTYKTYLQQSYLQEHEIDGNEVLNIITINTKIMWVSKKANGKSYCRD